MQKEISRGYLENIVSGSVDEYIAYLIGEGVMRGNHAVVSKDLCRFVVDDIIKKVPNILDKIGELNGEDSQQ